MKRTIALLLVCLLSFSLLTACSGTKGNNAQTSSGNSTAQASAQSTAAATSQAGETTGNTLGVKTLTIGLMTGFAPYSWQNDDGSVDGFEVAVVKEGCKRLGIEPKFIITPWESLLTSLDSGYCDVVSCQLWRNEARLKQYNMCTVPYFECGGQLLVGADNNTIKSLDTVNGAKIGTTVGDAWTTYLETYNKEHNNVLKLQYYNEDISTVIQDVANGRVAATLNDPVMTWNKVKAAKLEDKVKLVGGLEGSGCCYLAFEKSDRGTSLSKMFDEVYLEMINDGTMSSLSNKWFNADYTGNLLKNIVK